MKNHTRRLPLHRLGLAACLVAVLAGCASTPAYSPSVRPGTQLEVRQSLDIPYGSARVFLQGGRVVARANLDHWSVYCSVQTRPIREAGESQMKVEPGRFDIYEVRQFNDINRTGRIYTAALGMGFDEWPAFIVFQVEMRLRSVEQPQVRALFCAKVGNLSRGYGVGASYPSQAEIRTAVGDLIEIGLP